MHWCRTLGPIWYTPGFIAYLARPGYLHDSNAQARATDNQRLWEEGEALLNELFV